ASASEQCQYEGSEKTGSGSHGASCSVDRAWGRHAEAVPTVRSTCRRLATGDYSGFSGRVLLSFLFYLGALGFTRAVFGLRAQDIEDALAGLADLLAEILGKILRDLDDVRRLRRFPGPPVLDQGPGEAHLRGVKGGRKPAAIRRTGGRRDQVQLLHEAHEIHA